MPGKRENVISWDEFFMRAAVAASLRSKDPNTQVGACIADTNNLWVHLLFLRRLDRPNAVLSFPTGLLSGSPILIQLSPSLFAIASL